MNKNLEEENEENYKKWVKDLEYQRYYSRWPIVDDEIRNLPLAEIFHLVWTQYAKILDNGNGLNAILNIQKQLNFEFDEISNELKNYPDDASNSYRSKLKRGGNLLYIRIQVLKKLLTTFSIHGEIENNPDFELNGIQKIALNIVCKGNRKPNKRKILEVYMQIHEAEPGKTVKDIFTQLEFDYDISYSTFAGWIKKLNEEIESITLSQ